MIFLLALSTSEGRAVIKATSPLQLFVRDATQIVQVRVAQFDSEKNRIVFEIDTVTTCKSKSHRGSS
jgi:hypothetical protein